MNQRSSRRSLDDYYIRIAWDVSRRGNCRRRAVGALLVNKWNILSVGYNSVPIGSTSCIDGGCPRCLSNATRHKGYDRCICIHAEQNAILLAARQGTITDGLTMYTTLRPCLDCLKMIVQAGIREIVYDLPFLLDDELEATHRTLQTESGIILRQHPFTKPLDTPELHLVDSDMPSDDKKK